MSNYSFLAEAEAEYLEAIHFYEEQRAGLGNTLIGEFERVIGYASSAVGWVRLANCLGYATQAVGRAVTQRLWFNRRTMLGYGARSTRLKSWRDLFCVPNKS